MKIPPELVKEIFDQLTDHLTVENMERAMLRPPRRELVLFTFPVQGGEEPYRTTEAVVVEDGVVRKIRPGETQTGWVFNMKDDGSEITILMPLPEGKSLDE